MPAVGSVVLGIRLVLAGVFAVAGVAKLFDRNGSRQALADFGVPAPAVPVAAWLLPLVELATAIALIPPSSARWGALAALVLLLGFVAGIANALRHGKDVDCGCFGKLYSAVAGRATLARNAALAVGAGIVLWQGPGPSIGDWVSARTAAELVAIAAVAAALVLGVAVVRLWRERRDLREDVDELREQLGALPSGLPVGAVAPAFALSDLHGETRTLESLCARGRPVVLVFISPSCGPCQQMLPELGRWQAALADRLTVAVVSQGTADENRPAAEEHGIANLLLDQNFEVMPAYRVEATPSAVVVTPDGTIASPAVSSMIEVEPLVRLTVRRATAAAGAGPASAGPASAEPTLT